MLRNQAEHFPVVRSPRKNQLLYLVKYKQFVTPKYTRTLASTLPNSQIESEKASLSVYFSQPTQITEGPDVSPVSVHNSTPLRNRTGHGGGTIVNQKSKRTSLFSSSSKKHAVLSQYPEAEFMMQRSLTYGNEAVIVCSARQNSKTNDSINHKSTNLTPFFLPPHHHPVLRQPAATYISYNDAKSTNNTLQQAQLKIGPGKVSEHSPRQLQTHDSRTAKKQLRKHMNLMILKKSRHSSHKTTQHQSPSAQAARLRDRKTPFRNHDDLINKVRKGNISKYSEIEPSAEQPNRIRVSFSKNKIEDVLGMNQIRKRIEQESFLHKLLRYENNNSPGTQKSPYFPRRISPDHNITVMASNNHRIRLNGLGETTQMQSTDSKHHDQDYRVSQEKLGFTKEESAVQIKKSFGSFAANAQNNNKNRNEGSLYYLGKSSRVAKTSLKANSKIILAPLLTEFGGFQLTGWQADGERD